VAVPLVEEFNWPVPRAGFRWLTAHTVANPKRERWLTDGQPFSLLRRDERIYRPLREHTGLFLIFAELQATEDDIAALAGRFGSLLGDTGEQIALRENAVGKDLSALAWAERADVWQFEINAMKSATAVWTAIRDNDSPALERFLKLNPLFGGGSKAIAGGRSTSENPAWLCLNYIQAEVNLRLEHQVTLQLERDPKVPEAKLILAPKNLLGALWLQFSLAVEGHKEFRQCAQCQEPFEVSVDATGRRPDARFCRGLCRVKNYRERIATARRLSQQGVSHREIAKQLDTEVKTVKAWVSNGE